MDDKATKKFIENTGFICTSCGKIIIDGHKHNNQEDLCDQCKIADLEGKFKEMTKKFELASLPMGGLVDTARNLEKRLVEKDKEIEKNDDEWRKICDDKLETINRLIEEKHELEETIKNKSHNKWLKSEAERYKNEYQSLKGYIDQLKQQLAEKDAEVKSWKDGTMVVKLGKLEEQLAEKEKKLEFRKSFCRACQSIDNKTAISELEKVKVKLNEEINNASVLLDPVEYEDYHELLGVIRGYKLSVDQIDQQIKSLKGDK